MLSGSYSINVDAQAFATCEIDAQALQRLELKEARVCE